MTTWRTCFQTHSTCSLSLSLTASSTLSPPSTSRSRLRSTASSMACRRCRLKYRLSMSDFMNAEEYAGVMTEGKKELCRERVELPHCQLTTEVIQQCIAEVDESRE